MDVQLNALWLATFAAAGVVLVRLRTQQAFTQLSKAVWREMRSVRDDIYEIERELDQIREELENTKATASQPTPSSAGADLTSPAPAVSPGDRYPWRMENDEDDGA